MTEIGDVWYMELITKGIPPLRTSKLGKKSHDKEEEIKNYMKLISGGMVGNSN